MKKTCWIVCPPGSFNNEKFHCTETDEGVKNLNLSNAGIIGPFDLQEVKDMCYPSLKYVDLMKKDANFLNALNHLRF